jgi:hypothetical protein
MHEGHVQLHISVEIIALSIFMFEDTSLQGRYVHLQIIQYLNGKFINFSIYA